jgi:hypothetical protein
MNVNAKAISFHDVKSEELYEAEAIAFSSLNFLQSVPYGEVHYETLAS